MLKRLYADNYRCYSNFEIKFDSLNLLMGVNGVGKSTLLQLLAKIRALITQGAKVTALFSNDDRTRWHTSNTQQFEIEVDGNGGNYRYEFALEHQLQGNTLRLLYERLWFNAQPLLKVGLNDERLYEVQLYRDDHSAGPVFPFDWLQAALSSIPARHDNQKLTWFREWFDKMIIVQVSVTTMAGDSSQESTQLDYDMQNFVSWFRYLSEDQGLTLEIAQELQEVFPGFRNFKFEKAGEQHRILKVIFAHEENSRKVIEYRFSELSDGQRALIALYSLLYSARSGASTLCIDEPENFLALQEIQPWLTLLFDLCSEGAFQSILISHHPKIINYLANSQGIWLDRLKTGLVRAQRITEETEGGISIAELVARGWIYDE